VRAENKVVRFLNRELGQVAKDDPDVRVFTTFRGVGYYVALLVRPRLGM